jgi:hypothetical protein
MLLVNGSAQIVSDSTQANTPWSFKSADKFLKFSPLDVISYSPNLGADLEVSMKKNYALQAGLSIYPDFLQFMSSSSSYNTMFGYRSRIEGRVYRSSQRTKYFAISLSMKHMLIKDEFSFGMERTQNMNGMTEYAYFQTKDMWMHRFSTFMDFKMGFQKQNKKSGLLFDWYFGLSIRNNSVKTWSSKIEGGDMMQQNGMWNLQDGHEFTYPTPIFGFKIGLPVMKNLN